MDLGESLGSQGVAEQLTHAGLDPEDGLVGGRPQVEDAVVQPGVLVDGDGQSSVLGPFASGRVLDLERKLGSGRRNDEALFHLHLHVLLGAALDLGRSLLHSGVNVDDAFLRNP